MQRSTDPLVHLTLPPTASWAEGVGAYRNNPSKKVEKVLMRFPFIGLRTISVLALVGVALCPASAWAQGNDMPAGVVIDAQGVMKKVIYADPGGQLLRRRIAAAKTSLNADILKFSKTRWVSLNRLERAMAARQGVADESMRHLAGLLRIQYVFYYPESKDIVIGGPAEGWVTNPAGRVVGITSGRPTLQLQDMVVALRAFPPGKRGTPVIACSIDPTREGLAAMQRFLRSTGSFATPNMTQQIVSGLRTSLGLQEVSISGVPADTHFAQVLVEADYRMKLIGIGLEKPPVHMVSFVAKANPASVSRNALFRWFFTPDYQCIRASKDGLAMQLVGDGVKLIGEDELVSMQGGRTSAGRGSKASQMFVTSFTKKYPELAERSPVFAELRNLIDMSVAAAFIQKQDYYGKSGWTMPLLGDESKYAVQTYQAPQKVASAVSAIWKGNRLMTPIGGGVQIQAARALKAENLLPDENGKVAESRQQLRLNLTENQWWWD